MGKLMRRYIATNKLAITKSFKGTATLEVSKITIVDSSTITSGENKGLYVSYTQSGAKTGTGTVHGISVDMTYTAAVVYGYNLALYAGQSGNPSLGFMAALSIYMDNLGTTVGAIIGIDIGIAQSAADPADRFCFIRMRSHNATYMPKHAIRLEGACGAENLLLFDSVNNMLSSGSDSTNVTHKIACEILGVGTRYLHLFSD